MPISQEGRKRLSQLTKERNQAGKLNTPELNAKRSASLRGRKIPLEQRQKQSQTRKRLFAEGALQTWNKGTKGLQKHPRGALAGKSWKGGKWTGKQGYVWVKKWGHPMADKKGYILEHRFIMSEKLKRILHSWESVHHKNGVRGDNRITNLLLVIRGNHRGKVICPFCHTEFGVR